MQSISFVNYLLLTEVPENHQILFKLIITTEIVLVQFLSYYLELFIDILEELRILSVLILIVFTDHFKLAYELLFDLFEQIILIHVHELQLHLIDVLIFKLTIKDTEQFMILIQFLNILDFDHLIKCLDDIFFIFFDDVELTILVEQIVLVFDFDSLFFQIILAIVIQFSKNPHTKLNYKPIQPLLVELFQMQLFVKIVVDQKVVYYILHILNSLIIVQYYVVRIVETLLVFDHFLLLIRFLYNVTVRQQLFAVIIFFI